ncbi:MAG: exodeoxyribonuclease VII small subunit [Oscillospiraceae bacterium]|jgi:exodeoxyribonuclease VII small subunit|nr:exodeoxyribonuclease VII small subunit [Oscillospiraceae bacterium]
MPEKPFDYEKSFRRLEEIAALLEEGSLPLEQSLKLFEEGAKLAGLLQKTLEAAEQKLTALRLPDETEPSSFGEGAFHDD